MRKLFINKIRIIFAAVALIASAAVFASCNEDNSSDSGSAVIPPVSISTDEYWDELFRASSVTGLNAVDASADLSLSFDLGLEVGIDDSRATVALGLMLVIDRTSRGADSGRNSALKLSLNGTAGGFSLIYLFSDPENLYIETADGKYALPFDTGVNDAFPDMVGGLLSNYPLMDGNSALDLIDLYTARYGDGFRFVPSIAYFLKTSGILKALGFTGTGNNFLDGILNSLFKGDKSSEDLIKGAARSGILCVSGSAAVKDGIEYEIMLSKSLVEILTSSLPSLNAVTGNAVFKLIFRKEAAAAGAPITSFFVTVAIPGYGESGDRELNISLRIGIPKIRNVNATEFDMLSGGAEDYGDFALNLNFSAEIPKDMFKITLFDKSNKDYIYNNYDPYGKYTISGGISLNLSDVTKSVMSVVLQKDGKEFCSLIFTAKSDTDGALILKFDAEDDDSKKLARVFADYVLSYSQSPAVVARFMESREFAVTGIALRTVLPVWTGPRESAPPDDILSDPRLAVSLATFLDRRFINGLINALVFSKNGFSLQLPSIGGALVSMLYPDSFTSLADFCGAVYYNGNYYQNGAETADFLDAAADLLRGSVFADSDDDGCDFLFKILSSSLVINLAPDGMVVALGTGDKTVNLSLSLSFGNPVSLPYTPPSAGAAVVEAPLPLIDWSGSVVW